jgi:hypothetical protein
MQNKSLTIRIPYGDAELRAAANAMDSRKANRETLRKFLVGAMQARMNEAKAQMPQTIEA